MLGRGAQNRVRFSEARVLGVTRVCVFVFATWGAMPCSRRSDSAGVNHVLVMVFMRVLLITLGVNHVFLVYGVHARFIDSVLC